MCISEATGIAFSQGLDFIADMDDDREWEDSPAAFPEEEEGDFFELTAGELPLEDEEEEDDVDPYYFIVPQQTPKGNIYQASRVGDVDRIRCVLSMYLAFCSSLMNNGSQMCPLVSTLG